jgi:hypothetical protein
MSISKEDFRAQGLDLRKQTGQEERKGQYGEEKLGGKRFRVGKGLGG